MVTRTYEVRTYGCQMNAHDSERVAGLLDEAGYAPVADCAQTDVVVFSTCAVRENADNKLDGNLGHLKPVKDRTPGMPPLDRFVVVCRSSYGTGWTGDHGSISPGCQLAGNGAALSPTPPWA